MSEVNAWNPESVLGLENFEWVLLGELHETIEVVNTVTATEIFSTSIAANTLRVGSKIHLDLIGELLNNSGNPRGLGMRIRLGGVELTPLGAPSNTFLDDSNPRAVKVSAEFVVQSATKAIGSVIRHVSDPIAVNSWGGYSITSNNGVVDTCRDDDMTIALDAANTLDIFVQHSNANANLSFKAHSVVAKAMSVLI